MSLRPLSNNRTFTDSIQGAHLGAILHGMQGEVDFGQRLLVLDGADGIVEILALVEVLRRVLHGGRGAQRGGAELQWGWSVGWQGNEGRVW